MAMSRDRVSFKLPVQYLANYQMMQLVDEIFETSLQAKAMDAVRCNLPLQIICRPSQFARFLIMRNKRGFRNGFKELEAELFYPEPEPPVFIVDVSKNKASKL